VAIQANKPNNRVFLLLGILLAALAFGGVLFALRQNGGNTSTVVVAKHSIPAGTTLTSDLVNTVSEPSSAVPSDAYTVTTAVVGKTSQVTIGANDPIVPAFFAAQPLAAQASTNGGTAPVSIEGSITKGYVALAIPTNLSACPAITSTSSSSPIRAPRMRPCASRSRMFRCCVSVPPAHRARRASSSSKCLAARPS